MQKSLFIYIVLITEALCKKLKIKTGFVYEETMDAKSLYDRLKSDKIKKVELYALCLYSPKFETHHIGELQSMEKVGDKITFKFIFQYRSYSNGSSYEMKTQFYRNILMLYHFTTHDNPYELYEVFGMIGVKDYENPIPSTNLEPWLVKLYSPFWMVDAAGEEIYYTRKVSDSVLADVLVSKAVKIEKTIASLNISQINQALDVEYERKYHIMGEAFKNSDEFALIELYRKCFKNINWNIEPISNVKMIGAYYYEQLENPIDLILKKCQIIRILDEFRCRFPLSDVNSSKYLSLKSIKRAREIESLERYCSYIDDMFYLQFIFEQDKENLEIAISIWANYGMFLDNEISVKKCVLVYDEEDQGEYAENPVDLFLEIKSRGLDTRPKHIKKYAGREFGNQDSFDEEVVITYKGGKHCHFHKIQGEKVTIYHVNAYSVYKKARDKFLVEYYEN